MTYLQLSLVLALTAPFMGAHSCTKNELSAKSHHEAAAEHGQDCKVDSDCIAINDGCCGCSQGGKKQALAKSMAEDETAKLAVSCAEVMCMQVISNDPSCKKNPICLSGRCVLR